MCVHVWYLIGTVKIKTHSFLQDVLMKHGLNNILYCTSDSKKCLFVIVSRDQQEETEHVYTHVFMTANREHVSLCIYLDLSPCIVFNAP